MLQRLGIFFNGQAKVLTGAQEVPRMSGEGLRFGGLAADEQDVDVGAVADDVLDGRAEYPPAPNGGTWLTEHYLGRVTLVGIGEDRLTDVVTGQRDGLRPELFGQAQGGENLCALGLG